MRIYSKYSYSNSPTLCTSQINESHFSCCQKNLNGKENAAAKKRQAAGFFYFVFNVILIWDVSD